jgi:hypothetical protein
MIDYVEIRGTDTEIKGIIDVATSVIWHSVYFGVGDFEIYTAVTPEAVDLLKKGHFVTRPNNDEVGIIERINVTTNEQDGYMIIAAGRFAKSILDRRLIYKLTGNSNKATTLYGNVETEVRRVVLENAINCPFDSKRNIPLLMLGDLSNIPLRIVDADGDAARKQVSYGNLLEYTDGVLEEYGLSSKCILGAGKLQYKVYRGINRSIENTNGNTPIIFSQEYDNLTSSEYLYDTTPEKNVALIGGEGEGTARFYSLVGGSATGLQRREIWVDASSISKTYKDTDETEKTYTDAEYKTMLDAQGKQELTPLVATESFNGTIDITNGNWVYNRDFSLGDIVTVQDNNIGVYVNVRIREATEVQDENGYSVEVNYQ